MHIKFITNLLFIATLYFANIQAMESAQIIATKDSNIAESTCCICQDYFDAENPATPAKEFFACCLDHAPMHAQCMQHWISQNEDNNCPLCRGLQINQKLIFWAALHGKDDVLKRILAAGANINLKISTTQDTALHEAVSYNQVSTVALLIKAGAKINLKNVSGKTALHVAAEDGLVEIVQLLLNNNAKRDIKDHDGHTALQVAAMNGHTKIVQLILNPNFNKDTINNNTEAANYMLRFHGHSDIETFLSNRGCSKDDVELFLSAVNKDTLGYDGITLLHILAALSKSTEMLKHYLNHGANKDVTDYHGDTPLHYAAKTGNTAAVKLLLKSGAKVNIRGRWGKTALDYAEINNHKVIIKLLKSYKQQA